MRTILRFIVIILIGLGIYFAKDEISAFLSAQIGTSNLAQVVSITTGNKVAGDNEQRQISPPAPLKVENTSLLSGENTADLTLSGIILYTNIERGIEGLGSLTPNPKLSESALLKLKDMLAQQYFDHISPDQKGIDNLGEEVNYKYIIMGENLAYGDFKSDEALVQSWMESPTHRANILNPKYSEIGVAVSRAKFKDKEVWVIVQHLGQPLE